jgi:hypothetical protein
VKRDVRKKPWPGGGIEWRDEVGAVHVVHVDRIDERGCVYYRLDNVERVTTLTVWPMLAARWR